MSDFEQDIDFIERNTRRMADALERIAAAVERISPPPLSIPTQWEDVQDG